MVELRGLSGELRLARVDRGHGREVAHESRAAEYSNGCLACSFPQLLRRRERVVVLAALAQFDGQ